MNKRTGRSTLPSMTDDEIATLRQTYVQLFWAVEKCPNNGNHGQIQVGNGSPYLTRYVVTEDVDRVRKAYEIKL